jgi:hypothetical protein
MGTKMSIFVKEKMTSIRMIVLLSHLSKKTMFSAHIWRPQWLLNQCSLLFLRSTAQTAQTIKEMYPCCNYVDNTRLLLFNLFSTNM